MWRLTFLCVFLLHAWQLASATESSQNGTPTAHEDSLRLALAQSKDDSARMQVYIALSQAISPMDAQKGLAYADSSLEIATNSGNPRLIALGHYYAGVACFSAGLLEQSATHFYAYLEYAQAKQNNDAVSRALINISAVQLQMKQYDKAEETLLKGLDFFSRNEENMNDSLQQTGLATIYNNLGITAKEKNENKKAKNFYQKGIDIIKPFKSQHMLYANLWNNLAMVYILDKDFDSAFVALEEAKKVRLAHRDIAGIAASYRNLGLFYQESGKPAEAQQSYDLAVQYAKETGSTTLLEGIYDNIYKLFQETGNADSALKYLLLHNEQMEKVNREETAKVLTTLELTFQYQEREKLQQAEQKRKEQWYFFITIILVFTAVIIGLLFFLSQARLRRTRLEKANAELANNNLQLMKQNLETELEVKNKELATNVMYQIQKNEMVESIVQKLLHHSPQFRKENQELIQSIIHDLEKTMEENVWNEFELRFQHVHNDFYQKLNELHPELSPNERRLCAFLRLNMTTKEIAAITGQTQRSIEVARTRLRKKLSLTNSDQGLIEFLSGL